MKINTDWGDVNKSRNNKVCEKTTKKLEQKHGTDTLLQPTD